MSQHPEDPFSNVVERGRVLHDAVLNQDSFRALERAYDTLSHDDRKALALFALAQAKLARDGSVEFDRFMRS
jgi:hypothetical protein